MTKRSMAAGHLVNKINRLIPEANAVKRAEWDGCDKGIWLKGSESYHEGERIFDYYRWDPVYSYTIHPKLREIIDNAEWYSEPNDPGTLMLWPGYE